MSNLPVGVQLLFHLLFWRKFVVLLISSCRISCPTESSWWTLVPLYQFFLVLSLPPWTKFVSWQLTDPLYYVANLRLSLSIPPVVPELRYTLGIFSLLLFLFLCWKQTSCSTLTIKGRRVVHADCPESVIFRASPGPQPAFQSVFYLLASLRDRKLLDNFPDVLSSNGFTAL